MPRKLGTSRFGVRPGVAFDDRLIPEKADFWERQAKVKSRGSNGKTPMDNPEHAYVCRLLAIIATRGIWRAYKAGQDIEPLLFPSRFPKED